MHPAPVAVTNNINAVAENNNRRLKHYREKVIKALKDYLSELDIARKGYEEMFQLKPNPVKQFIVPK